MIRTLASLSTVLAGGIALTGVVFMRTAVPAESSPPASINQATFDQHSVWGTWKVYCDSCHVGPKARAGLNLQGLDLAKLEQNGGTWEKILNKLRNRDMPPAGMPRPEGAVYDAMVKAIEGERDRVALVKPDPGHPTLHRLNRTEYANAIHDLLALDVDVSEMLPADDTGYGFDNIGDVLQVSPVLMERYLSASSKLSRLAIGDTAVPVSYQTYGVPHALNQNDRMGEEMPLGSRGGTAIQHFFPVDGEYEIAVTLQRGRADDVLGTGRERELDLRLDGERLELFTIPFDTKARTKSGTVEEVDANLKVRIPVKAGVHALLATFLKDSVVQEGIVFRQRGDVVQAHFEGVGGISVVGPYNVQGPGTTASREKIFVCHPAASAEDQACAERIIAGIARRAYRRPVAADDIAPLLALYKQGAQNGGFESGVRLALQKILVSPEFVFRFELDPPNAVLGSVHPVTDIELASRLSFFLWSSIPDDELLAVAEKGGLRDRSVVEAQVRRMLADSRSDSLVKNFIGQWLFLRNIPRIQPDSTAFPTFDDNLREALQKETELLVSSNLREDRSVADLLKTDYTFVNQRLAEHYGMKGIYGSEYRRVPVTDPNRQGLLGQASIMTVTSYPDRTAPTVRGKWVLEQLLGTPPPPPPPNVPALKEDGKVRTMTMRERMEEHRASPQCAACHRLMDPLGFALENYDGIGRWRDSVGEEVAVAIDPSGVLPDGTAFEGPKGLRDILVSKRDMFVATFTERLMTYALGRGVEEYDRPVIRRIVREASSEDQKWSSIILGIVNSAPFQMRRVNNGNS